MRKSRRKQPERLKRRAWSRKEAIGHLIDYGTIHHWWVARALTEPTVGAAGPPDESWVSAQKYNVYPWFALKNTCLNLNHLTQHGWHRIPESRVRAGSEWSRRYG